MYLIEKHLEKSLDELNKAYIIAESNEFTYTKNLEIVIDQIRQMKNKKIDTIHVPLLWPSRYIANHRLHTIY